MVRSTETRVGYLSRNRYHQMLNKSINKMTCENYLFKGLKERYLCRLGKSCWFRFEKLWGKGTLIKIIPFQNKSNVGNDTLSTHCLLLKKFFVWSPGFLERPIPPALKFCLLLKLLNSIPLPIPLNSAGCSDPKRPLVPIETGRPSVGAKRRWGW